MSSAPPPSMTNDPILVDNDSTLALVEDALSSLWSVANKLSRLQPTKRERYSVSIFGSARIKPGQHVYEDVKKLAKSLSEAGCDIVTGGGPGLMQAANEGSQLGDPDDKTRSIGIRVALPFEKEGNPFLERVYTHQTFFTRLHQFVRLSNAFIVVGGGIGTTLETLLVWQLLQVKHVESVPLILVGDMWADLLEWAKKHMLSHDPPLASAVDLALPQCVPDVDAAFALLKPQIDAH
jgi:uncharacterized protein (TIGR00725 family)